MHLYVHAVVVAAPPSVRSGGLLTEGVYAAGVPGVEDFDRYVDEHGIPEEHYPAAFALWIAESHGRAGAAVREGRAGGAGGRGRDRGRRPLGAERVRRRGPSVPAKNRSRAWRVQGDDSPFSARKGVLDVEHVGADFQPPHDQ